jgi:hypothetical protein
MAQSEPEYYAYLLRLWPAQEGTEHVWRASLQPVDSGELIGFACLNEMMAFLQRIANKLPAAREETNLDQPPG